MGHTIRSKSTIDDENGPEREPWQKERGERYGNRRKQVAELKTRETRKKRAQEKRETPEY